MRFSVTNFVSGTDRFHFVPPSKLSWRFFENNLMLTNWQPHWCIYLFVAQTKRGNEILNRHKSTIWWPIWQPSLLSPLTTRVTSVQSELVSNRQEQSKKMIGVRLINKLKNHGQTSSWFCSAKGKKYINQLWQIHVTSLKTHVTTVQSQEEKTYVKVSFECSSWRLWQIFAGSHWNRVESLGGCGFTAPTLTQHFSFDLSSFSFSCKPFKPCLVACWVVF